MRVPAGQGGVNDGKCHATLHSRISNSSSSTRSSTKAAQQRSARYEGGPAGQPEQRESSLRPRQLTASYAERAGAGPKAGSQYSMHDSQVLAAHHDLCGKSGDRSREEQLSWQS